LLSFAILAPISAAFLASILKWSGDRAISNFDLISFFLSPQGVLLIVLSATLVFATVFFELGGLALILLALRRGRRPSTWRTLQHLETNIRQLCLLGLRQFLILGFIGVFLLAIALITKATLLGGGDIYFYLQTKPPAYWMALSIVGGAGLAGAITSLLLLLRWIFSVPLVLIERRPPREALRESAALVNAIGKAPVLGRIAMWALGSLLIIVVSVAIQAGIKRVGLSLAGDSVGMVIAVAALIQAMGLILGMIVSLMVTTSFAATVVHLFAGARKDLTAFDSIYPESAISAPPANRRLRNLVFGGIMTLVILSGGLGWLLLERIQFNDRVAVTAHRGSSLVAPENTRAAVVRAIEDGSDFVEIDVQETADGIVVLIHDTDLRRLAGVNRNTWEVPYAEMKELDIGSWFSPEFSGERILTLKETIALVRGKAQLNIELKFNGHDKDLEAAVEAVVRETGFESECILMSLDYGGIRKVTALNERLKTGLTLTAGIGDPTRFEVDFLAVNANSVTRDLIERAHRAGMEIHVWTVNDPGQMLTMIHLGVDNIITDAPDLLVELLEERAELTNAEKTLLYLSDFLEGRL